MASLTLASLNFAGSASVNAPDTIRTLLDTMNEHGIKPELEVFDPGMINFGKYLINKKLVSPPYYFNILLGNIAGTQADLHGASFMLRELPVNSCWALAGIGTRQHRANTMAILSGGHARVGLEDNIYFDEGRTILATNRLLVERVVETARILGREIATPRETRHLLGLPEA